MRLSAVPSSDGPMVVWDRCHRRDSRTSMMHVMEILFQFIEGSQPDRERIRRSVDKDDRDAGAEARGLLSS